MADFSTSSLLEVSVSQSSLRSTKQTIEDEIGDVTVDVASSGRGGAGSNGLGSVTDLLTESVGLAETRNDLLRELLEEQQMDGSESDGGRGPTRMLSGGVGVAGLGIAIGGAIINHLASVNWGSLFDDAIDGAVDAASLIAGTVAAKTLITGSVAASALISGSVMIGDYLSGSIAPSDFITGEITATDIIVGTIGVTALIVGTVAAGTLITGTVAAGTLITGTVTASTLITGTLAVATIVTGSLAIAEYVTGAIDISNYIDDGGSGNGSSSSSGSGSSSEAPGAASRTGLPGMGLMAEAAGVGIDNVQGAADYATDNPWKTAGGVGLVGAGVGLSLADGPLPVGDSVGIPAAAAGMSMLGLAGTARGEGGEGDSGPLSITNRGTRTSSGQADLRREQVGEMENTSGRTDRGQADLRREQTDITVEQNVEVQDLSRLQDEVDRKMEDLRRDLERQMAGRR